MGNGQRWMRVGVATCLVLAGVVGALALGPPEAAPPAAAQAEPDEGELPRPDFSQWRTGDVHVHAAGDTNLDDEVWVSPPRCYDDDELGDVGDARTCAGRLVDQVADRAEAHGVDFVLLTEHVPWLGQGGRTYPVCVPVPPSPVPLCRLVDGPDYDWDDEQAYRNWHLLEEAADSRATLGDVHLLLGQEVGTAGAISVGPRELTGGLFCGTVNQGHFGLYSTPDMVNETPFDCEESLTLEKVRTAGGWGGINHPDNPDGGSAWHCYFDVTACNEDEDTTISAYDQADVVFDGDGDDPSARVRTIEIISGDNQPSSDALRSWDDLLTAGAKISAVGGSDAHTASRGASGGLTPGDEAKIGLVARTLAHAPDLGDPGSDFEPLDAEHPARRALRDGSTVATNGPQVIARVGDALPGGTAAVAGYADVRIDWAQGTFQHIAGDAGEVEPGEAPEIDVVQDDGPDLIRVVYNGQADRRVVGDGRTAPDIDAPSTRWYRPTDEDRARGWAQVGVPLDDDTDRSYVRVEAYYDVYEDGTAPRSVWDFPRNPYDANGRAFRYFAFTSPVYLERTAIEPVPGCGAPGPDEPPSSAFASASAFDGGVLYGNDDDSFGPVALPFTAQLFGAQYDLVWVNNNGTITFDGADGKFTPFTIDELAPPMIAPFFADVDTRAGPATVSWAIAEVFGNPALCVLWGSGPSAERDGVGYYDRHVDKGNVFQLLLVDRGTSPPIVVGEPRQPGDFDIYFNYERVEWETGDLSGGVDGFGGTSAGVGYTAGDGDPAHAFEMPGSRQPGSFVDPAASGSSNLDGIVHRSTDSTLPGRHRYEVRNGEAPAGTARIEGSVLTPDQEIVGAGSFVQVCRVGGRCEWSGRTTADGRYAAAGLPPGTYTVRAFPGPELWQAAPGESPELPMVEGQSRSINVVLEPWVRPPADVRLDGPSAGGGTASVAVNRSFTISHKTDRTGCLGAFVFSGPDGARLEGGLDEVEPGIYRSATVTLPTRGTWELELFLDCGDGDDVALVMHLSAYIDPSGVVRTTGGAPLADAEVTLLRGDGVTGPFSQVPAGSVVMSPDNRRNPVRTGADGVYRWDTITGYYLVRAERAGCHAPGDPATASVTSEVLEIPPPATDVDLVLECPGLPIDPTVAITSSPGEPVAGDGPDVTVGFEVDRAAVVAVVLAAAGCDAEPLVEGDVVAGEQASVAIDPRRLPAGRVDLAVCAVADDGGRGRAEVEVHVLPVAPPVGLLGLAPGSDTGAAADDGVTAAPDPLPVQVALGAPATVTLERDGAPVATVDLPEGIVEVADPGPLTDGIHTWEVVADFGRGVTRRSAPVEVVVDRRAPQTTLAPAVDGGRLAVAVTADEPLTTASCSLDGVPADCTALDDLDATRPVVVEVVSTDRAGNVESPPARYEHVPEGGEDCTIEGTEGADVLIGTSGRDVICGFGGADVLLGLGGDDVLLGGEGIDVLSGDGGADLLEGGEGIDVLLGGAGDDDLVAGEGPDGLGPELLVGGLGWDRCRGHAVRLGCEH